MISPTKTALLLKSILLSVCLLSVSGLMAREAFAQDRPGNTEIGVIVGEPTGLSMKFWGVGRSAIDLGLAWSFSDQGSLHIHSNYLLHNTLDNPNLALYYGLGARLLMRADPNVGIRIPFGIQFMIPESRLSLFFELAPMLDLMPSTDFDINGGLGLRFFL